MFSCHLEAVSIEQDMRRRDQFDCVMNVTFIALIVLFLGFGVAVYTCLGEATGRVHAPDGTGWVDATIMQNLDDGPFVYVVKGLMSINLVLMMPITLLPASRALEQLARVEETPWARALLRGTMIALLAIAASIFPGFEAIVGMTGALGGVTCFTLPALCYAHFCQERLSPWQIWVANGVAIFGVGGTLWSFLQQIL
mmetsp:Transcript_38552/g.101718  ORF Transcript_38552/g.101718 Transcript_38552/m.101718 type:complete len:197 (-) Transcript_38552:246-836(-)